MSGKDYDIGKELARILGRCDRCFKKKKPDLLCLMNQIPEDLCKCEEEE